MWVKFILALLAIVAGAAVAFQAATNQGLMKATAMGPALIVNTSVVMLGVLGLWAVTGRETNFFPGNVPWVYYFGGACGFVVIATSIVVMPRLGAAYTIALMVCGQCLAALVIDHFGLLGMSQSPITLQRLLGVALVAGGVAVFRL